MTQHSTPPFHVKPCYPHSTPRDSELCSPISMSEHLPRWALEFSEHHLSAVSLNLTDSICLLAQAQSMPLAIFPPVNLTSDNSSVLY